MFEIYKSRKWTYLIPVVLFWGVVPILLYVIVNDFIKNGFSASTIMGPLCTCMVAFFGYMFLCMYRIDPYERIKKLKVEDPALVERMEADFNQSKMVCPHIWRGLEFYFFEGSANFLVVKIGEVTSFSIKKGYSKSIGPHYDCSVEASNGKAEFAVALIHKDSDNLIKVANEIAFESGIELLQGESES